MAKKKKVDTKTKMGGKPEDVSFEGDPDTVVGGGAEGVDDLEEFYAAHPEALQKWEDDGVVAAVAQTHKPITPVGKLLRQTTTPRPEKKVVRSSPRKKPSLRKKGK